MRENNYQYKRTSKMDWLSQIPSHWFEVRLGSLFNERKSKVSDVDYPPLSVTKNGVVPQLENAAKSNDGDNRKLVLNGDFVINSRSDRKGSSGLSRLDGSVSLINIVLRPIENIHPKFSEYLLKSYFFKEEYYRYGRGIVEDLWTTRYSEMKNMIVPKPPFEEQTTIARFLDYKLAKINRFIQKKKQLIKLLNEQKAAIINQAVTKGLDPNAKVKNSGIEWLGEIPDHWVVKPIKYFVTCNDESLTDKTDKDYQLRYIDIGNVDSNGNVSEIVSYKFKDAPSRARRIVKEGDIIVSTVRTYLKAIMHINGDTENLIVSTGFAVLRPRKNVLSEFLNYAIRANYFIGKVVSESNGVSYPAINSTEFITLKIAIRMVGEQKKIVQFIDSETEIINTTISKIEKELVLTEEYKTALIAEAVTGKIDVRGFEVPEISEEETYEEIEEEISMAAEDAEEYQTLEE